jgi:hypothetical protein
VKQLQEAGAAAPGEILTLPEDLLDGLETITAAELRPEYGDRTIIVLSGLRAALRWKKQLSYAHTAPLSALPGRLPHWTSLLRLGNLGVATEIEKPPFVVYHRQEYKFGDD